MPTSRPIRRPRSCCSSTCGPRSSATRCSTRAASWSPRSGFPRKSSTRSSAQLSSAPVARTTHDRTRGHEMLRRGRPIMRTAAVVGTAAVVSGSGPAPPAAEVRRAGRRGAAAGHEQQPRSRSCTSRLRARRARHERRADAARAAARPGHPHRRGVRGEEGPDPRDLSSPRRPTGRADSVAGPRAAPRRLRGSPEAREEQAWVGTRWRIRTRTFAHVLVDHRRLASGLRRAPPRPTVRRPC